MVYLSGTELSIEDVAKLIVKNCDYKGNIVFDKTSPDGQICKTASNKKLRTYLPDFKFTDTETAIKDTITWFKLNQQIARK